MNKLNAHFFPQYLSSFVKIYKETRIGIKTNVICTVTKSERLLNKNRVVVVC